MRTCCFRLAAGRCRNPQARTPALRGRCSVTVPAAGSAASRRVMRTCCFRLAARRCRNPQARTPTLLQGRAGELVSGALVRPVTLVVRLFVGLGAFTSSTGGLSLTDSSRQPSTNTNPSTHIRQEHFINPWPFLSRANLPHPGLPFNRRFARHCRRVYCPETNTQEKRSLRFCAIPRSST
jgi:hypothetical protein